MPGDVSSAAYFVAAGVLVNGSRLLIRDVGVNWTRTGFLRILERMGGIVWATSSRCRRARDARRRGASGERARRTRAALAATQTVAAAGSSPSP